MKDKEQSILEKYKRQEITAWKAARLMNIPLTEFLEVLKKNNMFFNYSKEELEHEFKGLI